MTVPAIGSVDLPTRTALLALEKRLATVEEVTLGGATDHGSLTGLVDDDHTQYHNDARGDVRYAQRANNLSDLASAATARTNLGLGTAAVTSSAAYEPAGTVATHEAAADPHTGYQKESEKGAISGYASLDAATKVPYAQLPTGTAASTIAAGDDSRITGAAQKASNLSDLASAATARTNLGLGTAATTASTAYEPAGTVATHAAAADPHTGYQKESEKGAISGYASLDAATKVPYAQLPTGTAASTIAAGDDSRITGAAQKASNLSDLANAATARTNLGLGTAATTASTAYEAAGAVATHEAAADPHTGYQKESEKGAVSGYASLDASTKVPYAQLPTGTAISTVAAGDDSRITGAAQKASNLSDLASASTARTNLGLGAMATAASVATANIDADAVTNAKLANVATATIKGRVTAATGDPEDLTSAQATTLIDTFTSLLKGLAPASGGGTANFLRADGTWTAPAGSDPAVGGDLSGTASTAQIVAGAVGNTELADMATATFKGRVTAGTGDPEDMTAAQATTLIDTFTSLLKGLAPASGGGTANFLRADGTWAAPPAAGDPAVGGDLSGTASNAQIVAGAVAATELATNAVTTVKITDANVTTAKIADLNVTTGKLADDAVTNAKLANVATSTIKGRVTAATGDVEDLTVAQVAGMLSVGGDLSGLMNNAQIVASAVGATELATNAVTTVKITDANVTEAKLADGSVTNAKLSTTAGTAGGAWTTWTPTLSTGTLGNGTVVGRKMQVGKTMFFTAKVTRGTTTSFATGLGFNLPATAQSDLLACQMSGVMYDGLATYLGLPLLGNTTSVNVLAWNSAGAYASGTALTNAIPFAWGTGDIAAISGVYEVA